MNKQRALGIITSHVLLAATLATFSDKSKAELVPHVSEGVNVVYSTEQDITLSKDAHLFKTLADSYNGPYASLADEIIALVGSVGDVNLIPDDFNSSTGGLRWYGAMGFVQWMNVKNYAGSSTWRLWEADPNCGGRPGDVEGIFCPDGELGYLYLIEGQLQPSTGTANPANRQGWSADPPGILPRYFDNLAIARAYWARNNDNAPGWSQWMISQGGAQLAYSKGRDVPNFFSTWPVQTGVLGKPYSIFKDDFEDAPQEAQ